MEDGQTVVGQEQFGFRWWHCWKRKSILWLFFWLSTKIFRYFSSISMKANKKAIFSTIITSSVLMWQIQIPKPLWQWLLFGSPTGVLELFIESKQKSIFLYHYNPVCLNTIDSNPQNIFDNDMDVHYLKNTHKSRKHRVEKYSFKRKNSDRGSRQWTHKSVVALKQ